MYADAMPKTPAKRARTEAAAAVDHTLMSHMHAALAHLRSDQMGPPPHLSALVDACTTVQAQLDRAGAVAILPPGYAALQDTKHPRSLAMGDFHVLFGNILIERELKAHRMMMTLL
jgi:hypothetical protein